MKSKFSFSLLIGLIASFVSLLVIFNQHKWTGKSIIQQDARIYFSILPATFYHQDPSFAFLSDPKCKNAHEYWLENHSESGKPVLKYTIGVAILQAPLYLIGLAYHKLSGAVYEPFGIADNLSVALSTYLAFVLALYFSSKVLRHYFSDAICALGLAIIFLATNVYHYTVMVPGYAHVYSLMLFALIWHLSLKAQAETKINYAIGLGLLGALIMLVRPSNVIMFLLPLFVVPNSRNFKQLINFWIDRRVFLLVAVFSFILGSLPQILLWKFQTGHFLVYGYGKEGFHFNNVQLLNGWFSFRNGWMIYSPIMILLLPSFYFLFRNQKQLFLPLLLIFILNNIIIYSWWCWWYGGSFGSRPQVDSALLSGFIICTGLQSWKKSKFIYPLYFLVPVFIGLNLFQSYQANKGLIHWDSMTLKSYTDSFLRMQPRPLYQAHLKHPDYKNAVFGHEYPIQVNYSLLKNHTPLSHSDEFNGVTVIPTDSMQQLGISNLYYTCAYSVNEKPNQDVFMVFTLINKEGETLSYQSHSLHKSNLEVGKTYVHQMEVGWDPVQYQNGTKIKAYLWNPHFEKLMIHSITITNF